MIKNTKRLTIAGLANTLAAEVFEETLRSLAFSQTSDSCTRLRMIKEISAGTMEKANSQRQPRPKPVCSTR